jgi:shikimate dehydrogenase
MSSDHPDKRFWNLGLIGYPLSHSRSPELHRAALEACGLRGDYRLYPIPPNSEGLKQIKFLIEQVRSQEIQGLNVTIPHKKTVQSLVDELTPTAAAIGAVNTILHRGGSVIGENTDAAGFLADLARCMTRAGYVPGKYPSALVMGAGGAARAVVYVLVQSGWQVTVAARHVEQAAEMSAWGTEDAKNPAVQAIRLAPDKIREWIRTSSHAALLINATPAGMYPYENESPWPDEIALPEKIFLYDLVYNPQETRLLRQAKTSGIPATGGLGMLVEQAAYAFESWTGQRAPRQAIFTAAGLSI